MDKIERNEPKLEAPWAVDGFFFGGSDFMGIEVLRK